MPTTLAQKLQLKAAQKLAVLNAPRGQLEKLKAEMPEIAIAGSSKGECDAVIAFVNSLAEADKFVPLAISAIKPDGLLWIAYPKGGSKIKTDVNRDRLWKAASTTGWRPVRLVAMDGVWSAMRFRPADRVGK